MTDDETNPRYWHVGQIIYYRDGSSVTLKARKPDNSGWWITNGGGIADSAVRDYWSTIQPTPDNTDSP